MVAEPAINVCGPMKLLLVRHGQSEWNAQGRWQGQADPPLTELGRRQARLASQTLGTFDAIVASPLLRASETAAIISAQMGVGPVVTVEGLKERSAGEWSGLTRAEIEDQYPGYLAEKKRPPGYELDPELSDRVRQSLTEIEDNVGGDTALVVCHGGVIYVLEEELGEPWVRLGNLGARWIDIHNGRLRLGERANLIDEKLLTTQDKDIV